MATAHPLAAPIARLEAVPPSPTRAQDRDAALVDIRTPKAVAPAGALSREPLSRTALRAVRLKPAPGQDPVRRVWAHRRREYVDLFDPAACIPMRAPRPVSEAQRAALEAGRRRHTHALCACCAVEVDKFRLSRDGLCQACVQDQAEEAFAELQAERLAELQALFAMPAAVTVFLDCETTGLGYDPMFVDEILELALVDQAGTPLLHSYVKPQHRLAWPEAQAIHGISPADVAGAPSLDALLPAFEAALAGVDLLVIYNAPCDLSFLPASARTLVEPKARCAMRAMATWRAWRSSSPDSERWCRFTEAAAIADHVWEASPHRALADATALRSVWNFLGDQVRAG